uniref:Uncharacterized protein n=1 Tax=Oryza barthii TaxID=65489 RepID=A0A0D3F2C5_9ORYZ
MTPPTRSAPRSPSPPRSAHRSPRASSLCTSSPRDDPPPDQRPRLLAPPQRRTSLFLATVQRRRTTAPPYQRRGCRRPRLSAGAGAEEGPFRRRRHHHRHRALEVVPLPHRLQPEPTSSPSATAAAADGAEVVPSHRRQRSRGRLQPMPPFSCCAAPRDKHEMEKRRILYHEKKLSLLGQVSKSSEGVDSNGCGESVTLPPLKTRWATATATASKPVLQARRWRFPRSGAVL